MTNNNNNSMTLTRNDILPFYVVKTRSGKLLMATMVGRNTMILTNGHHTWEYLSRWDIDLCYSHSETNPNFHELDIVEVYGFVTGSENYARASVYISTDNRPLLWTREKPVEMTVEEIEKKLGHKIKIVAEK